MTREAGVKPEARRRRDEMDWRWRRHETRQATHPGVPKQDSRPKTQDSRQTKQDRSGASAKTSHRVISTRHSRFSLGHARVEDSKFTTTAIIRGGPSTSKVNDLNHFNRDGLDWTGCDVGLGVGLRTWDHVSSVRVGMEHRMELPGASSDQLIFVRWRGNVRL